MKAQLNTTVATSSRRTFRVDEVVDLTPEVHARMVRRGLVRTPGAPNPLGRRPTVPVEVEVPVGVVLAVAGVSAPATEPLAAGPTPEASAPVELLSMEAFAALDWNEARAYAKPLDLTYTTKAELLAAYAAHLEG